jgi:hypothetical protein
MAPGQLFTPKALPPDQGCVLAHPGRLSTPWEGHGLLNYVGE